MPQINIETFDTTLRDGAQALPISNQFPEGSKTDIAHTIAGLGVNTIEAGFPATPGDAQEVQDVAGTVGKSMYEVRRWTNEGSFDTIDRYPVVAGLSRTTPSDIETTWHAIQGAVSPRIHTFVSTDSDHMRAKFPGKSPDDVLKMGVEAVNLAVDLTSSHPGATVEFSAEAASTTDLPYLERVVKSAIQAGADIINVPDTVGQKYPDWMKSFYLNVIEWAAQEKASTVISAHNHNDMGLATANTFALVHAAAAHVAETGDEVNLQAETTVCGLGERAGNADIFQFIGGLFKFSSEISVPVYWEFNPQEAVTAANMVMGFAGLEVHRQAPLVGRDINTHRSGIHSSGVIRGGHRLYTPHDPTFWGHSSDAIHEEGKYQGKAGRSAITTPQ